jgi:hypothetical protein
MLKYLMAILAVMVPLSVLAADGSEVSPREQNRSLYYLCDSDAAADEGTDCAEFNLNDRPYAVWVGPINTTGCTTAWEVAVKGHATSGGDQHTLATLGGGAGDDSAVSIVSHVPKFITVTMTTMTGCTDFDLAIDMKPRNQ